MPPMGAIRPHDALRGALWANGYLELDDVERAMQAFTAAVDEGPFPRMHFWDVPSAVLRSGKSMMPWLIWMRCADRIDTAMTRQVRRRHCRAARQSPGTDECPSGSRARFACGLEAGPGYSATGQGTCRGSWELAGSTLAGNVPSYP